MSGDDGLEDEFGELKGVFCRGLPLGDGTTGDVLRGGSFNGKVGDNDGLILGVGGDSLGETGLMYDANKGALDKLVDRRGANGDPLGGVFTGEVGGDGFFVAFSTRFKFVGLLCC
jgi:hypothetical protein